MNFNPASPASSHVTYCTKDNNKNPSSHPSQSMPTSILVLISYKKNIRKNSSCYPSMATSILLLILLSTTIKKIKNCNGCSYQPV
jgi:hypothetical protein